MTVAVTSTSSAVTVDVVIDASTVGLIVTLATEPPAASDTSDPPAAFTEPTVVVAEGATVAARETSPGNAIVEPVTVARVSVVIVLVLSAPPLAAA